MAERRTTGTRGAHGVSWNWMRRISHATSIALSLFLLLWSGICLASCTQQPAQPNHNCCPNQSKSNAPEPSKQCDPGVIFFETAKCHSLTEPHLYHPALTLDAWIEEAEIPAQNPAPLLLAIPPAIPSASVTILRV